MSKPQVETRRVIVEWDSEEEAWRVMWPDGHLGMYEYAETLIGVIKRQDARSAGKANNSIYATQVEWRNVPAGFEPPA